MTSTFVSTIMGRGYWKTSVRPLALRPDRLVIGPNIVEQMRSVSVQLRGWDFPHVDFNTAPMIEMESIGQNTDWKYFRELWRVYKSGQCVHWAGMRHDWGADRQFGPAQEDPGNASILGVGDAIYRFMEVGLFGSAYVAQVLGGEPATVTIEVGGLRGRHLVIDDPRRLGFTQAHVASTERPYSAELVIGGAIEREAVLAWARTAAQGLFRLFGAEIGDNAVDDWQGKVGGW